MMFIPRITHFVTEILIKFNHEILSDFPSKLKQKLITVLILEFYNIYFFTLKFYDYSTKDFMKMSSITYYLRKFRKNKQHKLSASEFLDIWNQ
jgi:hypothetical protein